ncbi:hypothetical protein CJD36_010210 [Flavipsychrobacter stenotrophus]|uniref:Uncharacterized protein n=1 Tax=Flavipsychrobacter stenotrophus TaxID=2077091 RepID=A0A2S7SUP6_9BACT|nr:hypothetical protein [Flavipsychrobacter stenotrophus]PQJ10341.1 hypothetical protein CJD36_010210 [Flavipsychrobacter stenotrophus]
MITMKKVMMMAALSVSVLSTQAQDFKAPLKATWDAFDTTKSPEGKVALSNKLALIAKKWPDEWATHFYAGLSKVYVAYDVKDEAKCDAILDEAEKERDEVVTLLGKKETDETVVFSALIANARMAVNPMQRWQKYGKIFGDKLREAGEMNPNNPRVYYLKAVSTRFTPKAFGGGKKAALPYFEKAEGLYAKENSTDITKPYWGKNWNTFFMADAKTEDKDDK